MNIFYLPADPDRPNYPHPDFEAYMRPETGWCITVYLLVSSGMTDAYLPGTQHWVGFSMAPVEVLLREALEYSHYRGGCGIRGSTKVAVAMYSITQDGVQAARVDSLVAHDIASTIRAMFLREGHMWFDWDDSPYGQAIASFGN